MGNNMTGADLEMRWIIQNRLVRIQIAFGAVLSALGFFLASSEFFAYHIERIIPIDAVKTGILLLTIGVSALILLYLQSGGIRRTQIPDEGMRLMFTETAYQNEQISKEIDELKIQLSKQSLQSVMSPEEKQTAIDNIVAKLSEDAIQELFDTKASALRDQLKKTVHNDIRKSAGATVDRMRREIADLRLRANVNLGFGMAITFGGLYLLWTTIVLVDASTLLKTLASEGADTNAKFAKNLILPIVPRFMLVVFIEVFAYFFLRLYRNGLSEIKYFQNELTNFEAKLIAVEYAVATDHAEALKTSLESLARTERNFILEKGQTTVELERAKSESELTRNIIKTLPEMFKKSDSK